MPPRACSVGSSVEGRERRFRESYPRFIVEGEDGEKTGRGPDRRRYPVERVSAPKEHEVTGRKGQGRDARAGGTVENIADGVEPLLAAGRVSGGRDVLEASAPIGTLKEQRHSKRGVVEVPPELPSVGRIVNVD